MNRCRFCGLPESDLGRGALVAVEGGWAHVQCREREIDDRAQAQRRREEAEAFDRLTARVGLSEARRRTRAQRRRAA